MTTFASAAPYYAQYRPTYPDGVFDLLTNRFELNGSQAVLDLGCGTGAVAIPLAPFVRSVDAVDPEPAMLGEGRRIADERGATGIRWHLGDSTTLTGLRLPPIDLCTMGKSFHWMNQPQVLADLDRIVAPNGGLAFLSGARAASRPNWLAAIEGVAAAYLGPDYRQEHGPVQHPADDRDATLAQSKFRRIETTLWKQEFHRPLDELVGLQFSFSYSSPHVLGAKKDEFERDLRDALLAFDPIGIYHNTVQIECTIATRS
ncbi:class I SAM-dependent methyltransferase [Streptomyces sp. NPDC002082]|uniref:class I SAM-dependent methyltransferase n=1 Tax=Streptomyces sp. NPDC002082 TaxID=3154772 RepID=UPI0033264212